MDTPHVHLNTSIDNRNKAIWININAIGHLSTQSCVFPVFSLVGSLLPLKRKVAKRTSVECHKFLKLPCLSWPIVWKFVYIQPNHILVTLELSRLWVWIIHTGISIVVVGRLIVALIRKSRSFGFQCLGFNLGLN